MSRLLQRTAAVRSESPVTGVSAEKAAAVVAEGGKPLAPEERDYFEPIFGCSFSDVRIHTDDAATSAARSIGAKAFTFGPDIGFAAGEFRPHTGEGRRLIAHELTHVVQQQELGAAVQRQPSDAAEIEMPAVSAADFRKRADVGYARTLATADALRLRKAGSLSPQDREDVRAKLELFEGAAFTAYVQIIRPALIEVTRNEIEKPAAQQTLPADLGAGNAFFERMRNHDAYIDNHIVLVEYFTAEQAILHYSDGLTLTLGLVPKYMNPPFQEVDYHTARNEFNLVDRGKDGVGFLRLEELVDLPASTPYSEFLKKSHKIEFYAHGGSGRIVPSHINMLTAPTLCQVLLDSEGRWLEEVELAAQLGLGGTAAIGGYAGAGGLPKNVGVGLPAGAGRLALSGTARTIAREMDALLARGGAKTIAVEGVELAGVEVARRGSTLAVKRFMSKLPEALRGQGTGSRVNAAFEHAAIEVARLNGAKTVTINVGIIINPGWRALLEARGYVHHLTEGAWIKTIHL